MTPVGIDISKELLEVVVAKAVPGLRVARKPSPNLWQASQMMRSSRLRPPAATPFSR